MGIDLKLLKYVISRKIKSLSHSGIGVNRYRQKNCEVQLQKKGGCRPNTEMLDMADAAATSFGGRLMTFNLEIPSLISLTS